MNPNGLKFIYDPKFREQFINDYNFWFVMIGLSYFIFFGFVSNLFIPKHFKTLLWIAITLCLFGNIMGFLSYRIGIGSALGALNGPLITLLTYKFLYDFFKKKYRKPPVEILRIAYSSEEGLMNDRLFYFVYFIISCLGVAPCALMYGG